MVTSEMLKKIYFLLPFVYPSYHDHHLHHKQATFLSIDRSTDWSYEDTQAWGANYSQCNGRMQSPIDLSSAYILPLVPLRFLNYDLPLSGNVTLFNNGHTAEFEVPVTTNGLRPSITGGLLRGTYEADNVHFHWGSPTTKGSEHTIKGRRFDVEMHIVHRNNRYATIDQALQNRDGIAVLGIFFQIVQEQSQSYPALDAVFNRLPDIIEYESESNVQEQITLGQLLGNINTRKFFTYSGSLTTPPCSEAVTWNVFPEPLLIAGEQIMKFFALKDFNGDPLINNFRPLQRRNNRPIFERMAEPYLG